MGGVENSEVGFLKERQYLDRANEMKEKLSPSLNMLLFESLG